MIKVICKEDFCDGKGEGNLRPSAIFKKDNIYMASLHDTGTPSFSIISIWYPDTTGRQISFWLNNSFPDKSFFRYFYSPEETKNMLRVELIDKMIYDNNDKNDII